MKLFFVVVFFLLFSEKALSDIYRYIDKDGSVIITNELKDIPPQFRSKVEVIKEEKTDNQIKPVSPPPKTVVPSVQEEKNTSPAPSEKTFFSEKNGFEDYINLIILALSAIIFIFAHKILFFIGNRRVIMFARFAIILIFLIYIFNRHIATMVDSYLEAKKDVTKIKKNIETKDLKIDQITK